MTNRDQSSTRVDQSGLIDPSRPGHLGSIYIYNIHQLQQRRTKERKETISENLLGFFLSLSLIAPCLSGARRTSHPCSRSRAGRRRSPVGVAHRREQREEGSSPEGKEGRRSRRPGDQGPDSGLERRVRRPEATCAQENQLIRAEL